MKYSKEFFQKEGLLIRSQCVPLINDQERGLFLGIYGKSFFPSIDYFVMFTMNISSLTQEWYSKANLDEAYQWYYPPETENPTDGTNWLTSSKRSSGCFVQWLKKLSVPVDFSKLPQNLTGEMNWVGDAQEFGLIGNSHQYYFEAYIADRWL